jgi:hypothetical protein
MPRTAALLASAKKQFCLALVVWSDCLGLNDLGLHGYRRILHWYDGGWPSGMSNAGLCGWLALTTCKSRVNRALLVPSSGPVHTP